MDDRHAGNDGLYQKLQGQRRQGRTGHQPDLRGRHRRRGKPENPHQRRRSQTDQSVKKQRFPGRNPCGRRCFSFPRATSQVAMLAWIFGDCREGSLIYEQSNSYRLQLVQKNFIVKLYRKW